MKRSWNAYLFTCVLSGTQYFVAKHFLASNLIRGSDHSYFFRFDYISLFLEFAPLDGFLELSCFPWVLSYCHIPINIRVITQSVRCLRQRRQLLNAKVPNRVPLYTICMLAVSAILDNVLTFEKQVNYSTLFFRTLRMSRGTMLFATLTKQKILNLTPASITEFIIQ